jgi:hypothetical protein
MQLRSARASIVVTGQQTLCSRYAKHNSEMIFGLLFNRANGKHAMMRGPRAIGTNSSGRGVTMAGRNMRRTVSRCAERKPPQESNK